MTDDRDYTAKEIAARFAEMQRGEITSEAVDEVTRATLEGWFGLPSFTQVAEGDVPGAKAIPADTQAAIERRDRALAAVEPRLLAAIGARAERRSAPYRELPPIELRVREDIAITDLAAIDRGHVIAEPREVELPVEMQDDLKECVPQALLRDLHRAELYFDKTFEMVDMAAEQRMDIVAVVAEAMRTSSRLSAADLTGSPLTESLAILAQLKAEQHSSWAAMWKAQPLPNRKVTE